MKTFIWILIVLLVAAGAFASGAYYIESGHSLPGLSATASVPQNFSTAGVIISYSASAIKLQLLDGTTKIVPVAPSTQIINIPPAVPESLSDLRPGDRIAVITDPSAGANATPQLIQVFSKADATQ